MSVAAKEIAVGDRIPLGQKLAFSAGGSMDYFATVVTMNVLCMPYFNLGLGLSPWLVSVVLMILRGWDAIVDPIMGNVSDNARTRWGRRLPFMVVGASMTAALYPLLWRAPAGWGEYGVAGYLLAVGMLFFLAFSCWSMPYYGLQLELTPNYDERTRLTAWMTFFGKITGFAGSWTMAVVSGPWFADAMTGKPDLVRGVKTCSWGMAVVILGLGMLPPLFVRERYRPVEFSRQATESLWKSLAESIRCRPLWDLIGISFFLVLGSGAVSTVGQYINIYLINAGDLNRSFIIDGWKGTTSLIAGVLTIPLWTWLGERLDKKLLVGILLSVGAFGHLLNFFCLRPDRPYLQLFPAAFESCVLSAVWMFLPSMKADVSDWDELHTTRRREGALNAFYSWFIKAALTCALGAGGLVLEFTGFVTKLPVQPRDVLLRMKYVYLFLPVVIWAGALAFIWRYPLSRLRMGEIRDELEARRGCV